MRAFAHGLEPVLDDEALVACSVAVKQDGSIWTWGDNSSGQLGDGPLTDRYSPVSVLPWEPGPLTPSNESSASPLSRFPNPDSRRMP